MSASTPTVRALAANVVSAEMGGNLRSSRRRNVLENESTRHSSTLKSSNESKLPMSAEANCERFDCPHRWVVFYVTIFLLEIPGYPLSQLPLYESLIRRAFIAARNAEANIFFCLRMLRPRWL
jgi:hypothetical protein